MRSPVRQPLQLLLHRSDPEKIIQHLSDLKDIVHVEVPLNPLPLHGFNVEIDRAGEDEGEVGVFLIGDGAEEGG